MATVNTFLYWVQELHRESGAAGRAPTTVTGVTGEAARLVGWVKEANQSVQRLWDNWKFLRTTYSQACTAGTNTLAAPADIGAGTWDLDSFMITESGQSISSPILVYEYDNVKQEPIDTSSGVPWRVVVMPDNSLRLESTPNAAHVIAADYYREPAVDEFDVDADTSTIPAKFQRIILAEALLMYAEYEGAQEAKTKGDRIKGEIMPRLENSQLPNGGNSRYKVGAGRHIEVIAQ